MRSKTGVLLLNLGTPLSPQKQDVRAYLKEFLDDPRVIDLPCVIRKILLHVFILPFRTAKSAKAYAAIWDAKKGSPLLFHTQDFAQQLQNQLGENYQVEVGMRYAAPSIQSAIEKLLKIGVQKIMILPLFPQYSSAATGSALEKALHILSSQNTIPELKILSNFYDDAGYIAAQSAVISPYLQEVKPDAVIFSYHSLPERHIHKTPSQCAKACFDNQPCPPITSLNNSCYRAQCYATTRLIAQQCALPPEQYQVVFQSRLGRTKWIGPELIATMHAFIQKGVKNLVVASPSFVVDCLETLEEIGIRAQEEWKAMGGERFTLVPCLNAHPAWVKAVEHKILSC